jgi:hypothetical protein
MVRPLRLARVAAQAEMLVVRRQVTGLVRRAILGAVAAIFALGVLIIAHIIAYLALRQYAQFGPIPAAGIVLGVDLVVTIIFGVLASGQPADPIMEEAIRLRDQSLEQARQSLTLAAMVAPITRIAADAGVIRLAIRLLSAPFRRSRHHGGGETRIR